MTRDLDSLLAAMCACSYVNMARVMDAMFVDLRVIFQCRMGLYALASGSLLTWADHAPTQNSASAGGASLEAKHVEVKAGLLISTHVLLFCDGVAVFYLVG